MKKPDIISYGHDIEAAWLLQQWAEIIDDENRINIYKKYAVKITDVVLKAWIKTADSGMNMMHRIKH